jgi:hypothetical protein
MFKRTLIFGTKLGEGLEGWGGIECMVILSPNRDISFTLVLDIIPSPRLPGAQPGLGERRIRTQCHTHYVLV